MLLNENSEAQQAQNPSVAKFLDQHEADPAWEGEGERSGGWDCSPLDHAVKGLILA